MNKKEQAEFAALRYELEMAKALCFKDYAPEEIDTNKASDGLPTGGVVAAWWVNKYSNIASAGCFSRIYHSRNSTTKPDSQTQGGPWYATEVDALKALRMHKQEEYAETLADIDRKILLAQDGEGKGGEPCNQLLPWRGLAKEPK